MILLIEKLKAMRAVAVREADALSGKKANLNALTAESFHRGRQHALDQVLAMFHPGHLQDEQLWKGKYAKDDSCTAWGVWACDCKGTCRCHWADEIQGIPVVRYDDSGGQAAIFDCGHPALELADIGGGHVWKETRTLRACLSRLPTTQAEIEDGIRCYRQWFGKDPDNILLSYREGRHGVALMGPDKRSPRHILDALTDFVADTEGMSKKDIDEALREEGYDPEELVTDILSKVRERLAPKEPAEYPVDIPGLLRWRRTQEYEHNQYAKSLTAVELVYQLSVEGLPGYKIPARWSPSVRAFRKLNHSARIRKAEKFLEGKL